MTPPQQKAKALLQKKLDEIVYCKDTLIKLQYYTELSESINQIIQSSLYKQWFGNYNGISEKLQILISSFSLGSTTPIPSSVDLTSTITEVGGLLSEGNAFKIEIIEEIQKIPDGSGDNAALIKIAKKTAIQIKARDEQQMESSADSTMTDMATLVEEAEDANKQVEELVSSADSLTNFYDTEANTVKGDNLVRADTFYTEMKSIVERIDKVYADAQKILGNVSVFDKGALFDAQKSVNTIAKIKIEIYIAAAKSLATLVTNMAKSAGGAGGAADAAITAGEKITAADISVSKDSDTSDKNISRSDFVTLTQTFDAAFAAYDSIILVKINFLEYSDTYRDYLTIATKMVQSFKGNKTELSAPLKKAEGAGKVFDEEKNKVELKYTEMKSLKSQMVKFKEYMIGVDEKFLRFKKLMDGADEDLQILQKEKGQGMLAFEK